MTNIVLRDFNPIKDLMFFVNLYNKEENMKFIPFKKGIISKEDIISRFYPKSDRQLFVIEDTFSSTILGEAGIYNYETFKDEYELGYIIDSKYWNKGFGKKICSELINFVFNELKGEKVICRMYKENIASIKVSESNKMILEREDLLDNGLTRLTYFIKK